MDDESSFRWAWGMFGVIIVLVAIGLSLGYSESVGEDSTTIAYSWIAKLAWLLGGFGSLIFGWKIRERSPEVGYGILCIMPMVLLFALPRVMVNQVRVDSDGFTMRTWGFVWYDKTEIKFNEYNRLTYRVTEGRRGRMQHQLVCDSSAAKQKVLGAGGMLGEALPAIAGYAEARGMAFSLDAR